MREAEPNVWEALARPARRLPTGAKIEFAESPIAAQVISELPNGVRLIRFESSEPLKTVIERIGETPLPPYIKRSSGESALDRTRYQTVYAKDRGAIAAPTACSATMPIARPSSPAKALPA